ncbi:hypothetical protein AV274_3124 [Blastocystis sp. ATCC 50177/Nand II]|uniref:Prefoldin subunit 6 n=1 Tax=Blastocystis sp. subtype 1 (strain ATCC 50177 / NandII) TaxID=478820 RepID=A0A196SDQ8_BLAHN|nr:hypothetical protein AV274_3124 [Blastocystis sp. ATCC 50177/Nand II]
MPSVEELQKEAADIQKRYDECQKSMVALNTSIEQTQVAMNENTSVQNELNAMKEDQKVYKLVGPVLIHVDLEEAKSNVANRIKLIKRQSEDLAEKAKKESDNYKKIEDEMIKLQQKVAMLQVDSLPKQK